MRLVSPVRLSALLLGWLLLALPAAAQNPAGRALPPPPDARFSLPPDPAAESAADAEAASGPASLRRVGEWGYGPSYAIAALDDATVSGHGRILRIETPDSPVPTRQDLLMPGLVRDVATDGARVFVATGGGVAGRGITVVETWPSGSRIAGGVYGRTCVSLARVGPRLYAVVYDPGLASYVLLVLDATAPVPTVLGQVAVSGTGGGIAALGTAVYVAMGTAGVAVIDAANPAAPAVLRYLEAGSFDRRVAVRTAGGPPSLAVGSGTYPAEGSVTVFGLAVPAQPALSYVTAFARPVEDVLWNPNAAVFSGFLDLYVAASYDGLFTLGSTGSVTRSAYTTTANLVPGVTRLARGRAGTGYLLVADYYYGTFAYDDALNGYDQLSEGTNFAFDAEVDAQDPATVYVADGSAGLVRLHAEADGRLVETGRAHDSAWNYARSVAQNATHLYVSDNYSGVHVVDKATLMTTQTLLGTTGVPFSNLVAVSADGQTLFVRDRQTATAAYALADPARPTFLWERTDLDPETYASANGALYVGEKAGSDVRVLSLADPMSPVQTATRPTDGSSVGVVLDGARLYAYGGPSRVSVFDVSAPLAPAPLGTVAPVSGSNFTVADGLLYTTAVDVFDARPAPVSAPLAAYRSDAGAALDVAVAPDRAYLSLGASGVERLTARITVAGEPAAAAAAALSVSPNPTPGRIVVAFSLAEAGPAEVDVVDVLGRRVAVLAAGPAAAGAQRVEWDGRDGAGRALPAGVYVVRVQAGGTVQTRAVTVVR